MNERVLGGRSSSAAANNRENNRHNRFSLGEQFQALLVALARGFVGSSPSCRPLSVALRVLAGWLIDLLILLLLPCPVSFCGEFHRHRMSWTRITRQHPAVVCLGAFVSPPVH